jgi:hypothetical protein
MPGTIHNPLRLSFLIICLSYLTACKQVPEPTTASKSGDSAPAWYSTQTIDAPGYWVGFGDALTLEQAKALARADLAATFKAQIRVSLRIEQDFDGDTLEQRALSRIEQFTSAEFDDLRTLKSEQQAGRYYLVLGYDHRPLHERLISQLEVGSNPSEATQQLPVTSRLYQQLQTSLGRTPALQLHHERGRYLLSAGNVSEAVHGDEIELLWPRPESSAVDITLNPVLPVYPPETLFTVKLQAAEPGFLNYVQVFGNGATVLMFANRHVNRSEDIIYPDPHQYDGLVTELPPGRSATRVQHLVMRCPDRRDLSRLEAVSTRAGELYQSFLLGEWNRLFDGCEGKALSQAIRR